VIVTKEFVLAVAAGISALRSACSAAEVDTTIQPGTGAAKMVAAQIERDRQHADLLAGWVQRHRGEAGLSEDDVYV
jgi:hypothetical protein